MIYLASPYTHESPGVQLYRAQAAAAAVLQLTKQGAGAVFSPIVYAMQLEPWARNWTHADWMAFDLPFIQKCDELFVLPLVGWRKSKGVQWEIDHFRQTEHPVTYVQHCPSSAYFYSLESVSGPQVFLI